MDKACAHARELFSKNDFHAGVACLLEAKANAADVLVSKDFESVFTAGREVLEKGLLELLLNLAPAGNKPEDVGAPGAL